MRDQAALLFVDLLLVEEPGDFARELLLPSDLEADFLDADPFAGELFFALLPALLLALFLAPEVFFLAELPVFPDSPALDLPALDLTFLEPVSSALPSSWLSRPSTASEWISLLKLLTFPSAVSSW